MFIALEWVHKLKVNPYGEVMKQKAKIVAKRFLHREGSDYDEVYALVARMEALILRLYSKIHMPDFNSLKFGIPSY